MSELNKEKNANIKEVNTEAKAKERKNRLAEAFTKDYKYEGLVLLVLALVALVLGIVLLRDPSWIPDGSFLAIGNKLVFPIILVVLGVVSVILSVWPYYKPSVYEVKRVTWPTKKTMFSNCVSVFVYTIVIAVFFYVVDLLFLGLMDLLGLGE